MHRKQPTAFVFYHYFAPDDVISAMLFGDLSAELVASGWRVTAFPCVWGCRDESIRYPRQEVWKGVEIKRLWRPRFRQSSSLGRLLNSLWMVIGWSFLALRCRESVDVVILGTDPPLSILSALAWRVLHRETRILHWCHDLFPEAAIADGMLSERSFLLRLLRPVLSRAYAACDVVIDLGPCMRRLLAGYGTSANRETIVPWAIDEPDEPLGEASGERMKIFGKTKLALLYSGTFGLAHSYSEILRLAQLLQPDDIRIAFSVGGNRQKELRSAVERLGLDIPFVSFASPSELRARLASADIHIVTLREEWTGMVVPSKFFGALSVGRPILFAGSAESSIAKWIQEYRVGWVLHADNVEQIQRELVDYAHAGAERAEMCRRCFNVYRERFSRQTQIARWNTLMEEVVS